MKQKCVSMSLNSVNELMDVIRVSLLELVLLNRFFLGFRVLPTDERHDIDRTIRTTDYDFLMGKCHAHRIETGGGDTFEVIGKADNTWHAFGGRTIRHSSPSTADGHDTQFLSSRVFTWCGRFVVIFQRRGWFSPFFVCRQKYSSICTQSRAESSRSSDTTLQRINSAHSDVRCFDNGQYSWRTGHRGLDRRAQRRSTHA